MVAASDYPQVRSHYPVKESSKCVKEGKIRLHKIVSNHIEVKEAFPSKDLEKNLMSLDIGSDDLLVRQSLGLAWGINSDNFTYNISIPIKPFTKRGLLSVINSLFDPLGFIQSIIIHGRIMYRKNGECNSNWDATLPNTREKEWLEWKDSLHSLENLRITRMFTPLSNRVSIILRRSKPPQWKCVHTPQNPADIGTRCLTSVEKLAESNWLRGPLQLQHSQCAEETTFFSLVSPEKYKEILPDVYVKKITTSLVIQFEQFSTFRSLVHAISNLKKKNTLQFEKE